MQTAAAQRVRHRVRHEAAVTVAAGAEALNGRAVNLSVGGVFVATGRVFEPGAQVGLRLELDDGGRAVDGRAEVVWTRKDGMALRFVGLDDASQGRIARLVGERLRGLGSRAAQPARVKLPSLPSPLRAVARESAGDVLVLEAELPWLRLGGEVTTELGSGRAHAGTIRWIGVDVTQSGAARLRILVHGDAAEDGAANSGVGWRATSATDAALARALNGEADGAKLAAEEKIKSDEFRKISSPRRTRWTATIATFAIALAAAGALAVGVHARAARPSLLGSVEPSEPASAYAPARVAIPRVTPEPAPPARPHHHHHDHARR